MFYEESAKSSSASAVVGIKSFDFNAELETLRRRCATLDRRVDEPVAENGGLRDALECVAKGHATLSYVEK